MLVERGAAAVEGFEDGEGRGDGDVVLDEVGDHVAHRGGGEVEARDAGAGGGLGRADVGLLAGVELGVDEQAVLQVVDAEGGGLAEADGAEVAGDLEIALVRGVDGGLQLGARDVHVGLEGGDALGRPSSRRCGSASSGPSSSCIWGVKAPWPSR